MAGIKHPNGLKRSFNNVIAEVSDQQLATFGKILETLSDGDKFESATITDNTQVFDVNA
nr:hypothetical protein [Philodulcilactobacillus myokoensis]